MLSKNVFARLFPALKDTYVDPDAATRSASLPNQPDLPDVKGSEQTAGPTQQGSRFSVPADLYTPQVKGDEQMAGAVPDRQPFADEPQQPTINYGFGRVMPLDDYAAAGPQQPAAQGGDEYDVQKEADNYFNSRQDSQPPQQEDAYTKARKRVDALIGKKVVNEDRGVKGAFLEGLGNFVEGIAQTYRTNPRASIWEQLAGGAGGLGGGFVDRTWNERRAHERELGEANRDLEIAERATKFENEMANDATQRTVATRNSLTQQQKLVYDQLSDQQKQVLDVYKEADEFDPNSSDALTQEIVAKAKALGVTLLPKKKGDRFTFNVTPDGKLVIGNSATGAYKVGAGNYARPTRLSDSDLPDSLFGLKSDKELEDAATAAVGQEFPNRRVRPEVASGLINTKSDDGSMPYRNPDGSLNEAKALEDGVLTSEGYENQPSNYEQRKAAQRTQLRSGQQWKRDAVTRFRSILSNANPGNTPVPLNTIVSDFKEILNITNDKERKKQLDRYFKEVLPNLRHQ